MIISLCYVIMYGHTSDYISVIYLFLIQVDYVKALRAARDFSAKMTDSLKVFMFLWNLASYLYKYF